MSQPVSPRTDIDGSDGTSSYDSSDGYNNSRYKNDFDELALIGEGGYSKVFRCRNKLDGKDYAIKVIPFSSETREERVLWEIKTLAMMCHSNVVMYHQAWLEEGAFESSAGSRERSSSSLPLNDKTLYIVLELCDGRTLEDRMPLGHDEAVKIFFQVFEGLNHIHKQGVIHGDISTSNIFFDKQDVAKIGDFGLARFSCGGRVDLTGQGPTKYSAPETCGDNPFAMNSSDVYSLGMIFFELFYRKKDDSGAVLTISDLKRSKSLPEKWEFHQHLDTFFMMIDGNPLNRPNLAALRFLLKGEAVPLSAVPPSAVPPSAEHDSDQPEKRKYITN